MWTSSDLPNFTCKCSTVLGQLHNLADLLLPADKANLVRAWTEINSLSSMHSGSRSWAVGRARKLCHRQARDQIEDGVDSFAAAIALTEQQGDLLHWIWTGGCGVLKSSISQ